MWWCCGARAKNIGSNRGDALGYLLEVRYCSQHGYGEASGPVVQRSSGPALTRQAVGSLIKPVGLPCLARPNSSTYVCMSSEARASQVPLSRWLPLTTAVTPNDWDK